jgi:outer membrane protein insertion porin family
MLAVYASILVILVSGTAAQSQTVGLIEEVQLSGNHRVPSDSIRYRIQTKAGNPLDRTAISQDVRTLYSLGYFEDIRVEERPGIRGPIIVFHFQERPFIRDIKYEGLRSITTSEIIQLLKDRKADLSPNSPYDPARVRRAEAVIRQILIERGHQNAAVQARMENAGANAATVTFAVDEGPTLRIESITIDGNKTLSSRELKSAMRLIKETGPLTRLARKDTYEDLRLNDDIARIRMLYAAHGYVRANVEQPLIEIRPKTVYRTLPFIKPEFPLGLPIPFWSRQEQRMHLTLKVEENAQYRVGEVRVTGSKEFSEDRVRFMLGMIPGTVYNEERLRKGLANLRRLYGERGYIKFTAVPVYDFAESQKRINLTVNIDEDRKFYVNRIWFTGNTTTRDKVIRRELVLNEGDVFNSTSWELSLLKLNQLGYFEPIGPQDTEMKVDPADGSVDLHLHLKEKEGNRIGFSGGVSGISGGFLGVNYSSSNFLGLGETLAVNLEGGTKMSQYQLSFTEPYLFSRPLSASVSLFSTNYQYDQSSLNLGQRRNGFTVASSYPLRMFHRLGLSYQLDNSHITSVDGATREFFNTLATGDQNVSTYLTRRLISTYAFNSVNNPINPTRGHSFIASLESAGSRLGGNVNFYRPSLEFKAFKPLQDGRNTLAVRLSASYVRPFTGKSVPFYERFFMGGDYDLRGFDYRSISPIAWIRRTAGGAQYDDIVRVGGDTQALLNFEYRIPLAGPITLAPFIDVGNSWVLNPNALRRQVTDSLGQTQLENVRLLSGTNTGLRVSTGAELQLTLPVINLPFRLIFAFNPSRIDQVYTGPTAGTAVPVREPWHGFRFTIGKTF